MRRQAYTQVWRAGSKRFPTLRTNQTFAATQHGGTMSGNRDDTSPRSGGRWQQAGFAKRASSLAVALLILGPAAQAAKPVGGGSGGACAADSPDWSGFPAYGYV